MHTGGEPVRIIESGYPPIHGETILDKRRYVADHLDHLRRRLMFEPRGHLDMYGVIPVEPDVSGADIAVLFMHNEGYSTMCGHATIAMGRYAVDRGLVPVVEPETRVVIQCPCGPVTARVSVVDGVAGEVYYESVGAFAYALDERVTIDGRSVAFDIGYGGAFYAIADADQFGLEVGKSPINHLIAAAEALTQAARSVSLDHPDAVDLGFLYGTILTDGRNDSEPSANVCVFADAQVDRSPTGSGVTARMALRHARGEVGIGESRTFTSITGSTMSGRILSTTSVGEFPAVTVEVGGRSFYTGRASFIVEPDDPFADGFLVR